MSQHMVMVLIIDIDPKHTFGESTYDNDLEEMIQ